MVTRPLEVQEKDANFSIEVPVEQVSVYDIERVLAHFRTGVKLGVLARFIERIKRVGEVKIPIVGSVSEIDGLQDVIHGNFPQMDIVLEAVLVCVWY